jgi:hypothetical protein
MNESVVYFENVINYKAYFAAYFIKSYPTTFDNFTFLGDIYENEMNYTVSTFYGVYNGETIRKSDVIYNDTMLMNNGEGLSYDGGMFLAINLYIYFIIIIFLD